MQVAAAAIKDNIAANT